MPACLPDCLSAKPCNDEVRNYGDVRGNAEFEKCDSALFIRSFFPPFPSLPPANDDALDDQEISAAHASACLSCTLHGKSKWHLPSVLPLGREPVSLSPGGPHTISLGGRGDRPRFASSFRKAVDKEKRGSRSLARSAEQSSPVKSGQVTLLPRAVVLARTDRTTK